MKRSCSFVGITILFLAFLLTPYMALSALDDCPRLPTVSWWSSSTHEGVVREILDKHLGDWMSHIASLETQLDRMKNIESRGKKAYIIKGSSKILVENLPSYISKLEKRISVIHCLREESQMTSEAGTVAISRKGDTEQGETLSRVAGCFGCHGVYGMSTTLKVPNLAGQNDLYLVKQMKGFLTSLSDGGPSGVLWRHSKIMNTKVRKLSDEDIWNLVAFYSGLSCNPGGQRGDVKVSPPRKAMLCVECHGNAGYSVYKEIPNLAGQSESYLFKQLKALRISSMGRSRSAERDQRYHLFMSQQVARLTNADISALAKFYSGLNCR